MGALSPALRCGCWSGKGKRRRSCDEEESGGPRAKKPKSDAGGVEVLGVGGDSQSWGLWGAVRGGAAQWGGGRGGWGGHFWGRHLRLRALLCPICPPPLLLRALQRSSVVGGVPHCPAVLGTNCSSAPPPHSPPPTTVFIGK